jgi:hypothetical protein
VALYHVTSRRNRESIRTHGLDWRFMGAAPGIAGSTEPEVDGVFLCRDEWELDYFVRMNNTGGPVDAWIVEGVDVDRLVDNGNGYGYLPEPIPVAQLGLLDALPAAQPFVVDHGPSSVYQSRLTITFDDGTVRDGEDVHDWLRRRRPGEPSD